MKILITGGAGFIGSNTADFYLSRNHQVVIFDNLSRFGTNQNLSWLKTRRRKPEVVIGEIRDAKAVTNIADYLAKADLVIHLAAQVAVTSSVADPRFDFEVNTLGTLNLLEVMRTTRSKAKLIYTSTNKVYGNMDSIKIVKRKTRYEYAD
jgi:CDP-paratose 2-epimerase